MKPRCGDCIFYKVYRSGVLNNMCGNPKSPYFRQKMAPEQACVHFQSPLSKTDSPPLPPGITIEPVATFPVGMLTGSPWTKPETPKGIFNIFDRIRTIEAWSLKTDLRQRLDENLHIDERSPGLNMNWDQGMMETLSWSDSIGAVGTAFTLYEERKGIMRYLAMFQVGGVDVDDLTYQSTPGSLYLRSVRLPATGSMHLVTISQKHLSLHGLETFGDPDLRRSLRPDGRAWYQITDDHWDFFIDRLVKKYEPRKDL